MKLREDLSAFLFLFELAKDCSSTQAFSVGVYLARVLEKPLHRVDFLWCILQLLLQRFDAEVAGKQKLGLRYLHLAFYWQRLDGDLVSLVLHYPCPCSLYQPLEN